MEAQFRQQYLRAEATALIPWRTSGSGKYSPPFFKFPRILTLHTLFPDGSVFSAEPPSEERESKPPSVRGEGSEEKERLAS